MRWDWPRTRFPGADRATRRRAQRGSAASIALACLGAFALVGCAVYTPRPPAQAPAAAETATAFSGEHAWQHLQALVAMGPRYPGSEGNRQAREYIRQQLVALGIEPEERSFELTADSGEVLGATNLVGVLPGEGIGKLLLVTHYDTDFFDGSEIVGANDGGSGPALLLELARVFVADPPGHTVAFAFLDAQSRAPQPFVHPDLKDLGARGLLADFSDDGFFEDVRLTVVFDQVADADLRLTRDLWSHRIDRQLFVRAAARLGHADVLPARGTAIDYPGAHQTLFHYGLRRIVTVMDAAYGESEPPGVYAHSPEDNLAHCSATSLATVGAISEAALRDATARWSKLDRVHGYRAARRAGASAPSEAPPTEATTPEALAVPTPEGTDALTPEVPEASEAPDPPDPPAAPALPAGEAEPTESE